MKFTDIPNFSKDYFEAGGALQSERGLLDVMDALPDDIVELVEEHWTCDRKGYIFEVWDDIAWDVAKAVLWDGSDIRDDKLAYLVITKAMTLFMESHGGYNGVAAKENIPMMVQNDTYMTQMDFLTISALAYTLQEVFSMDAVNRYFSTKMMENYYQQQFDAGLDAFPREQFEILLRQEGTVSDYAFDEFVEKAKELVVKQAPPKTFSIELSIPGGMNAKEVLKEIHSNLKAMDKDFDFSINPA